MKSYRNKFLVLFFISMSNILFAQAGLLDPSFVNGGSLITYLQGSKTAAMDVAVDSQSNIYVSGIAGERDYSDGDFVVVKYSPNGTIDSSFGQDGVASIDFGEDDEYGTTIEIQKDGKIVVAGTQAISLHGRIAVTRLNSNGTIDESFGNDGKLLFNPQSYSYYGWIQDMLIQHDGKILLGGFSYNGADKDYLIIRLNIDGSFDETFASHEVIYNTDGTLMLRLNNNTDEFVHKMMVTDDSSIILVGKSDLNPEIIKLTQNGKIDSTFGEDGSVSISMRLLEFGEEIAGDGFSGALQSDGQILIAGYDDVYEQTERNDFAVARLTSDGELDESFGSDGYAYIDYAGGNDWGRDILVDSTDKILVSGDFDIREGSGVDFRKGIARLTADGYMDNSFDIDGMAHSLQGEIGKSMAFSPDSAVVLVGTSNSNGFYVSKFLTYSNTTDVEKVEMNPDRFELLQNYPNPFNPSTTIRFSIPEKGNVSLKIYDILGKEITTLVNGVKTKGSYSIQFNGSNISSGVYIYSLRAENVVKNKKMVLLK